VQDLNESVKFLEPLHQDIDDIKLHQAKLRLISCNCATLYMKSSDAKASKCHLNFSSKMTIFIKLIYLSSVISLK